jgi:glycosyltransferase involved in cell wall biosynthesis
MSELVSIIIPIYNHSKFIKQCLNSIYEEDYSTLELIIIDDGSQDLSFEIAKEWCDKNKDRFERIHIEKQQNQGICKTLNKLILLAKGEYVLPLASDDYLLVSGINARIDALKLNPKWLAVIGDTVMVDEESNIIADSGITYFGGSKENLLNAKMMSREILLRWPIPGPIFMARKKAYDPTLGVGLYDENMFGEDADFYYRLLQKNGLGFVDCPVSCYRIRDSNTSRNQDNREKMLEYCSHSITKNIGFFKGIDRICLYIFRWNLVAALQSLQNPSWHNKIKEVAMRIVHKFSYIIFLERF